MLRASALALLALLAAPAHGCSNVLVSKAASSSGGPQVAYSADELNVYGWLRSFPRRQVPDGEMEKVWDGDTGVYLGEIPTARDADGWSYNVVGNTNEHGLSIGETTFGGLPQLAGQNGKIDYNSLIWYTLRMAKTAREAIHVMANTTNAYGYYSEGETFSIADKEEVWVMDFIGKGPGETGAVYLARKVPDGMMCAHANQARTTTWDHSDTENNIWAPDTISFARKLGLYGGADEDFSFSGVYHPITFAGCRLDDLRAWSILSTFAEDRSFADTYFEYVKGNPSLPRMPLFVKPYRALSVNDTMWLMRSHYEGTYFSERGLVGSGPYNSPIRPRPLTWEYEGEQYFNERTVGIQQSGWNFVATSRSDAPSAIAAVTWFAVDDASTGPHVPVYASARRVSEKWAEGSATEFNMDRAHWIYNMVANYAYARWDQVGPWLQKKIVDVEAAFAEDLKRTDDLIGALQRDGKEREAVELATDVSVSRLDQMIDDWKNFYGATFVRFHDYAVFDKQAPAHPDDKPKPKVTEVGYSDEWKARIVKENGDRFRIPKEKMTEMDWVRFRRGGPKGE